MNSLNKFDQKNSYQLLSQNNLSDNTLENKEHSLLNIEKILNSRRSKILHIIAQLADLDVMESSLVHDLNFEVTEYIFWSQFILKDELGIENPKILKKLSDHSIAMSYLTSAVQFVPECKSAVSHFIEIFCDRLSYEDLAVQDFKSA